MESSVRLAPINRAQSCLNILAAYRRLCRAVRSRRRPTARPKYVGLVPVQKLCGARDSTPLRFLRAVPARVILVDDVVVVAGRQVGPVPDAEHRGGHNLVQKQFLSYFPDDLIPLFSMALTVAGQFYAFDAVPRQDSDGLRSDFARGQYMIHNTNLHAASVSALAGWRDPYREEVRNQEDPPPDPSLPKAQYPYGRIITGAMDGTVGVWALCCGDRLAVWQAHDDVIWDVEVRLQAA